MKLLERKLEQHPLLKRWQHLIWFGICGEDSSLVSVGEEGRLNRECSIFRGRERPGKLLNGLDMMYHSTIWHYLIHVDDPTWWENVLVDAFERLQVCNVEKP